MSTVKTVNMIRGKTLNYRIEKPGYETVEGTKVVIDSTPVEVEMEPTGGIIDVTDYEYTLEGDTVSLDRYIGSNTIVKVPHI